MNITLFELATEIREVADKLADMDIDPQTVADTLESITLPFEQKAASVSAFIRNMEATAEQIKQAEAEMAKRRRAMENRASHIREYLLAQMQRTGITKIESPLFRISIRNNPESVVIDSEAQIPADYMREIPATYSPDKTLIRAALQDGYDVPGAHLARSQRVEIR